MAEFAQASYILNDKKLNKQQRADKVNGTLADKGYKLHDASNRDVQLFINDKTNHAVISHRGTDFGGRKIGKDVKEHIWQVRKANILSSFNSEPTKQRSY
jgi:hypothetical protein